MNIQTNNTYTYKYTYYMRSMYIWIFTYSYIHRQTHSFTQSLRETATYQQSCEKNKNTYQTNINFWVRVCICMWEVIKITCNHKCECVIVINTILLFILQIIWKGLKYGFIGNFKVWYYINMCILNSEIKQRVLDR